MEENKEQLSSQDVIDSGSDESGSDHDRDEQAHEEASSSSSSESSGESSAGDSSEDAGSSEASSDQEKESSESSEKESSGSSESSEEEAETTTEEDSESATTEAESTDGLLVSPDGRVLYAGDSESFPMYDSYEEFMASPIYVTRYENEILNRLEFIQYALALLIALIFLLIFRRK